MLGKKKSTGWDPRSTRDPSSSSSFTFKHPPNPADRAEPPKRTRGFFFFIHALMVSRIKDTESSAVTDPVLTSLPHVRDRIENATREPPPPRWGDDEDSTLLSAYHNDLEKVSEKLKHGKGVFSGTGMPDMSDSAWLVIKTKTETQKSGPTTEAKSVEPLQKDVDNLLVDISFSLEEETIQQIGSNPDPETAFIVMVRRRSADVKVSTLSAEQQRELVKAKDKELSMFVKDSVVEAASRQGISPSALMKMRRVLTFKDEGSLKARLVVQGFTDQRLGKIPTSSPNASRRSRQIFLTLAVSLGFQTHKRDVKCTFLQGDLDEQRVDDDDDDDNSKIESAQPFSDTFCETVLELSLKLQLEHHQCIRLLKAVYGLVNAPRRWYHRVATDLRNMKGEESVMEPCLWTLRDENGGIHALCSVRVGKVESRVFKQCGAQITQAYNKHTGTWGGFEISFTEYVKEISIITLPSHRRRDKKSKITPLELSQLRALNGQLLWLGMHCLPQLLAPLSLLMGQTPQATMGTIYEVNKLARKATAWARTPFKIHAHHSPVVVTYTDAGWTTRPDGTSQGGQLVFIANSELLQSRESNMSLISWHSSRLSRVARSSSAAETQAAADGDDEAVCIRLCLKEILFGQLDLRNCQSEARQISAALVVDCRGVYDALARSSSSCLGMKDKKSG